jgi:predicted membrane-bound spermidine synthase
VGHRHLYAIFFLSGMSGLVYEAMWSRYLRLFVGSAATAQILVLALFMGGMSFGAWMAGRRGQGVRRPIVAYGVVEGLVALLAFAYPLLFEAATRLSYDVLFPAVGPGGVAAIKWALASGLVFVPCVLLGATFPLMSVGILRRAPERSGEILSSLYFFNSFGAALGAVLAGYVLVPRLGLPGTLAAAGTVNLVIMAVALSERRHDPHPPLATRSVDASATPRHATLVRLMIAIAIGTGLSSFLYEVAWVRLLSMVLGSATRSFEVMLSAFVLGLALGGLWVRRRMDRFEHPIVTLGLIQIVMGLCAVATLPLYRLGVVGMSLAFNEDANPESMWWVFNVVRYAVCLLIMLPATFCAGMTLPLLTHVMLRRGEPESAVGRIYAVNTLGAIGGAVSAGLLLMPIIGLKGVIILGAAIDLALGIWALRDAVARDEAPAGLSKTIQSAMIGGAAMLGISVFVVQLDPLVLASSVFRQGRTRLADDYVALRHVDGRTASVTVMSRPDLPGYHSLYTNGKPDASVRTVRYPENRPDRMGPILAGDEPTQFLAALIPLGLRPQAKQAALIGIGSGLTSHALLGSGTLERLDTIEIEREMAASSKLFHPSNERVHHDPRSRIVFDDAKAYFAGAKETYDVIVSVPSNLWVSGVASLFTVEFYQEVKRYIAPGGILAQWIQGYELSDELLMTVLAALDREFADYHVFRVGSRDYLIVARPDDGVDAPLGPISPALFEWEGARGDAKLIGVVEPGQLEALRIANRALMHPFVQRVPANTDTHPVLDDGAERSRFFQSSSELFLALRFTPMPVLEVLGGFERPDLRGRIPDHRMERHVLREPDKALAILKAYVDDAEDDPRAGEMRTWKVRHEAVTAPDGDWNAWFFATYEVYNRVAPWIDLRKSLWWREVVRTNERADVPAAIQRSLALLDAIVQRDGPTLVKRARACTAEDMCRFDPRLIGLAGGIGLELAGAPAEERRYWADHVMRPAAETDDDDSETRAFHVLTDYLARD